MRVFSVVVFFYLGNNMGWNEFWGWALSDDDESYWEHLERDYGKDAPVIHAIMDTAVDTVVNFGGISYALNDGKPAISKETRDDVWEERHEILSVASCVPAIGTVAGAVDATLHAAESVENNVEFFVEGAVSEDEPIYDENGNIIGWKDKWMTDKMNEKRKYAQEHGVNATVNAVLTMTGANYFKGGKAAVQASKKGGNIIEKLFIKNVDEAADEAVKQSAKKTAAETAKKTATQEYKTASAEVRRYVTEEASERKMKEAAIAAKNETEMATHALNEGIMHSGRNLAETTAEAARKRAVAAAGEEAAAETARHQALQSWSRGIKAINFLQSSNDIRSFLVTAYTLGSLIPGDTPQK